MALHMPLFCCPNSSSIIRFSLNKQTKIMCCPGQCSTNKPKTKFKYAAAVVTVKFHVQFRFGVHRMLECSSSSLDLRPRSYVAGAQALGRSRTGRSFGLCNCPVNRSAFGAVRCVCVCGREVILLETKKLGHC